MQKYIDKVFRGEQAVPDQYKKPDPCDTRISRFAELWARPTRRKAINYDFWEYTYFRELLELYDIFCYEILQKYPEYRKIILTEKFLYKFGKFIFQESSGRICRNLPDKSVRDHELYHDYVVKREDSYNNE
jgi:hypothetical protein